MVLYNTLTLKFFRIFFGSLSMQLQRTIQCGHVPLRQWRGGGGSLPGGCGRRRGRAVERRPADGVAAARRQGAGEDLTLQADRAGGADRPARAAVAMAGASRVNTEQSKEGGGHQDGGRFTKALSRSGEGEAGESEGGGGDGGGVDQSSATNPTCWQEDGQE